jgi:3-oxoacyl-[acyl-carrier protein] reductase
MVLKGKKVVVTGGSEGLGEAMTMRLAVDSAKVWLIAIARSESNLEMVTKAIRSRGMQADYYV